MRKRAIIYSIGPLQNRLVARSVRSLEDDGWQWSVAVAPIDPNRGRAVSSAVDGESSVCAPGINSIQQNPMPKDAQWPPFDGPVLGVRAGAWLQKASIGRLPESDGFIGIGSTSAPEWKQVLSRSGGDFSRLRFWERRVPRIDAAYLSPEAAAKFRHCLRHGRPFDQALSQLVFRAGLRAVHLPQFDVHYDISMRILQVVTTLQIGGAERMTIDLSDELNFAGTRTAVAVLNAAGRATLPPPRYVYDLSHTATAPSARAAAIRSAALDWGADLVHAHLISANEARAVQTCGWPLLMTLHNMPAGWPRGLANLHRDDATLLIACSQTVEATASDAGLKPPVRTAWNGIMPQAFASPVEQPAGSGWRAQLGIEDGDRILLCIANPRAQKRLPLLPHVLQALDAHSHGFHVAIAGGPLDHPEVLAAQRESTRVGVGSRMHWLGVVSDIPRLLAAADALISVSAWEGLSIAHLEALAAGKPVVATDAGGTCEIAAQHKGFHLVPVTATPAVIADAVLRAIEKPSSDRISFPPSFTRHAMARRYRWLYGTATAHASRHPNSSDPVGLWLITNNFSTGGAQSSARRLLLGLHARGIKVRTAIIEEHPHRPTPGRRALTAAGIPVLSIAPPLSGDATESCEWLLEQMHADPAEAIVFWNLITSYKVLIADAILSTRVFDVSPGEMYFTSLRRFFMKPPAGFPYLRPSDYGRRLAGVIVKYQAEANFAAEALGCSVHVVPNGVKVPHASSLPASPAPPALLRLATAARISPDKRLDDLIDAIQLAHSRLPPYRLWIAGGVEPGQKSHAADLRRRSRALPVTWCGDLPDTHELMRASHLFLMISEPAGCPNASLEALAYGLPVIATDVGGAREQVIDGVTGKLVPARDPPAFAEALISLAHDHKARFALGRAARHHIKQHFSIEQMLDRYSRIFFGERDSLKGGRFLDGV